MLSAVHELILMARVGCRVALAAMAKILSPPASRLVLNSCATKGGTFAQPLNECLLGHLKVEIACK